ncbi:MAG: hypothetical protein A2X36_13365 [Elusimicrobia bacterium GWA2_69_24]|nr:MAG: hypothetical protein A2X36_13365 [Elusimicrobia bacterium GWA2_69_24]HBL15749.1 hypothetical protein [Elusimicrobiota bacterium]
MEREGEILEMVLDQAVEGTAPGVAGAVAGRGLGAEGIHHMDTIPTSIQFHEILGKLTRV